VRRKSFVTHVAALALGAAAAAAVTVNVGVETDPRPALSGDPAEVPSAKPKAPIEVTVPGCGEGCCAGSGCASAAADLSKCPSGRRCVACDPRALAQSRYRLRISAVHPAEHGKKVLDGYPAGVPEICIRAGASTEQCVPTQINEREGGEWNVLPLVLSGDDLSAQISLRLSWKGVTGPLASAARWTMPVALTSRSLCSGYVVQLKTDDGDAFGHLSLFMDDTHYVELLRAADVAALRARALDVNGLALMVVRTNSEGFALRAGPFDRQTAELVRWQLLEQQIDAKVSIGDDHVGEPLALP
jgi:hypothetical protein